jgi:uncharacterized membrane protein HdeD (DUF308 family)
MISINTLLLMFLWGMLTFVLGIFVTNWDVLTVPPGFAWGAITLCAVILFLLLLEWVYRAFCWYRARNKKSEAREHTHER